MKKHDAPQRLQKRIAASGLCSRRKAEELIESGHVRVNGVVVKELGTKVEKRDTVTVKGEPLVDEEPAYWVLYKPEGTISAASDPKGRKVVTDLVPAKERLYPVGRLDYDVSGVLLMTNDGDFAHALLHPSRGVEKEYSAVVEGFVRRETSRKISRGVELDGIKTKRARIHAVEYDKVKARTRLNIVVTEGRYHHVKRLFETFDHPVLKLKRVRFGCVGLEGLAAGEARRLKPHEYKRLMLATKKSKT